MNYWILISSRFVFSTQKQKNYSNNELDEAKEVQDEENNPVEAINNEDHIEEHNDSMLYDRDLNDEETEFDTDTLMLINAITSKIDHISRISDYNVDDAIRKLDLEFNQFLIPLDEKITKLVSRQNYILNHDDYILSEIQREFTRDITVIHNLIAVSSVYSGRIYTSAERFSMNETDRQKLKTCLQNNFVAFDANINSLDPIFTELRQKNIDTVINTDILRTMNISWLNYLLPILS